MRRRTIMGHYLGRYPGEDLIDETDRVAAFYALPGSNGVSRARVVGATQSTNVAKAVTETVRN
ncbi:MAG TPA: hypothetical protein VK694_02390 [Verrucomicrobiae bacterium]|nr:hypothetical protein [Verrucomicrobiae bacterium]